MYHGNLSTQKITLVTSSACVYLFGSGLIFLLSESHCHSVVSFQLSSACVYSSSTKGTGIVQPKSDQMPAFVSEMLLELGHAIHLHTLYGSTQHRSRVALFEQSLRYKLPLIESDVDFPA